MTIGTPVNVTAVGTASGTSIATGAVGKLTNERLLTSVTIRNPSAYVDPGITDSDGLSWTLIETIDGPASNPFMRTKVWGCNDATARGSMTVTGTAPAANAISVHVQRVPADNPLDFADYIKNSNGTGVNIVAATVPNSPTAIITYAVAQSSGAWTHPTGYTENGDITLASNSFRSAWAYDLASPGNPVSWSNANQLAKNMFAMALKETTGSTTIEGTGASTGAAATSGVSGASAVSVGASAGAATTSGVAAGRFASVASSSGAATAGADAEDASGGSTVVEATGSSQAGATTSGLAAARATSSGASTAGATTTGVGRVLLGAVGAASASASTSVSSSGISAAAGISAATAEGSGETGAVAGSVGLAEAGATALGDATMPELRKPTVPRTYRTNYPSRPVSASTSSRPRAISTGRR